MPKLQKQTLTEQAYDALLDSLSRQDIRPGDRLKLEDLALNFGVSPTPLRHALARLEAEGVVRSDARHGLTVVALSVEEMSELYEARLVCETYAANKATTSLTDNEIHALKQMVADYQQLAIGRAVAVQRECIRKDIEFHRSIVDLAHNRTLSAWFRTIGVHLQTLLLSRAAQRSPEVSILEHDAIFTALAARDVSRAVQAITSHIVGSRDSTLAAMASRSAAQQPGRLPLDAAPSI